MDGSKYCCPARRWRAAPARPKGSAGRWRCLSQEPVRPLDGGTFAARRGVRKGREDSLRRGDTSKLNPSTLG